MYMWLRGRLAAGAMASCGLVTTVSFLVGPVHTEPEALPRVEEGPAMTLTFTKKVQVLSTGNAVVTAEEQAKYQVLTPQVSTVQVTLGSGRVRVIERTKRGPDENVDNVLYDFDGRRVYVTQQESIMCEMSLHSLVALRKLEFENVIAQYELARSQNLPIVVDLFDSEILFGVTRPQGFETDDVISALQAPNGDVEYRHARTSIDPAVLQKGGKAPDDLSSKGVHLSTVTWLPPDQQATLKPFLTRGVRESWAHYLLYHVNLHPTVRRHVTDQAKIPRYIEGVYHVNGLTKRVELTLEGISITSGECLTLPPSQYAALDEWVKSARESSKGSSTRSEPPFHLERVYAVTPELDALLDRALHPTDAMRLPTRTELTAHVSQAIATKNLLSGLLACFEYSIATGDEGVTSEIDSLQRAHADSPSDTTWNTFTAALIDADKRPIDLPAVLTMYDSIDRDAIGSGAYFIDVLKGVAAINGGDHEAALKFLSQGLWMSPTLAGVYKDLGMSFYDKGLMWDAWACFDILRHVAPKHTLLRQIQLLEASLMRNLGEFY